MFDLPETPAQTADTEAPNLCTFIQSPKVCIAVCFTGLRTFVTIDHGHDMQRRNSYESSRLTQMLHCSASATPVQSSGSLQVHEDSSHAVALAGCQILWLQRPQRKVDLGCLLSAHFGMKCDQFSVHMLLTSHVLILASARYSSCPNFLFSMARGPTGPCMPPDSLMAPRCAVSYNCFCIMAREILLACRNSRMLIISPDPLRLPLSLS